MNKRPIGIMDSGIGGLTIVREVRKILPLEDIIYLGDTARLPYGTKSEEAIIRFSLEDREFLLGHGVKFIVVACYSASSVALNLLQQSSPIPVIGVIKPGVNKALRLTRNGKIGVIGTPLTIYSGAYEKAFRFLIKDQPKELSFDVEILGRACPLFVPLVEEGWFQHPATKLIAEEYLNPLKADGIDTLLLACTHFPLLGDVIKEIMGDINYVDAAYEVGIELSKRLKESGLENSKGFGNIAIYLTDLSIRFKEIGERFLNEPLKNLSRVSLKRVAGKKEE